MLIVKLFTWLKAVPFNLLYKRLLLSDNYKIQMHYECLIYEQKNQLISVIYITPGMKILYVITAVSGNE